MRQLLLTAAAACFTEHGFAQTTTKAIAEKAEVSETLIFRYFGGKDRLFDEAVLSQFLQAVERFAQRWLPGPGDGPGRASDPSEFVVDLLGFLAGNRGALMALVTVDSFDGGTVRAQMRHAMARIAECLRVNVFAGEDGALRTGLDGRLSPAVVIAALLGAAALGRELFADVAAGPDAPEIVRELELMTLYGVSNRSSAP